MEEVRADLHVAVARELAVQQQKVRRAQEVYLENREDLARLLPHLSKHGGSGNSTRDQEALSHLISSSREFGTSIKGMLLYFDQIAKDSHEPVFRSKVASATGSLRALSRSLTLLQERQAFMEGGGLQEIGDVVSGYIGALDSAIAQLALAKALLEDQEVKLRVANRISTLLLVSRRVSGTTLDPNRPTDLIDGIMQEVEQRDMEVDRYLFPSTDTADASVPGDGYDLNADLTSIDF